MRTILKSLPVLLLGLATTLNAPAATNVWSNGGGTKLWATPTDWSLSVIPGAGDTAAFFNGAAALFPSPANNTVSAGLPIAALVYGQSNSLFHTTKINPGVTLTIASTNTGAMLLDGTIGDAGSAYQFTNTITGAGGTLLINATNGNISIRQPTATAGVTTHMAVLDLSGLDTLNATISRLLVAGDSAGNPNNRLQGTLYLAKTNLIVATWQGWTGTNLPALGVSDGTGGNGGNASFLYLGQTNAIFADSMSVAGFLGGLGSGPQGPTTTAFNPAFTNSNPVAFLRGYSGSRLGSLAIADNSSASAKSTASIGVLDFSGGTLDALVDSLWVARSEVSAGGNGAVSTGTLTLSGGTLDVNTIELGYQMGDTTVVYPATGTLNVNGSGLLLVNSGLRLAHQTSPPPSNGAIPTGTLNLNGGTVQVGGGDILDGGGHSTVNVNRGTLNLQPPGRSSPGNLSAQTVVVSDGSGSALVTNAAMITSPSITINAGGAIAGNAGFNIGTNGSFSSPGFILRGGFTGAGSVSGDFALNPGAGLNPGGISLPGTLAFGGNLTLNAGSLTCDLADPSQVGGANDLLTVAGNLTLSGTNSFFLNALSGVLTNGTYQLINYAGTLTGNQSNLQVAGALGQSRHTFSFGVSTPGQINLAIAGSDSASLLWVGYGVANNWDLKTTSDWKNGGATDIFYNLDSVIFDDTGSAAPAVNVIGTIMPGTITVNNSTKNYTFSGNGAITGGASLTKQGSSSLTLAGTGTNDFTGPITVNGGQVTISGSGAANFPGAIALATGASLTVAGTGAVNLSGAITLNAGGTLTYNRSDAVTLASAVTGSGTLIQAGSGVLAVSGANGSFDGPILVNTGTLQAVGTSALGSTVGGTTIAAGATLDINGYNLGPEAVTVSGIGVGGNGAIINTGFAQMDALQNVTLAGDGTFGGSSAWSIRSEPTTSISTTLSTSGVSRKLTKIGPNLVGLTSVNVDAALGDIDIRGGVLSMENLTTSLGNPANTVTIFTNGTLQLLAFQTTSDDPSQFITLNKRIVMNDGSALLNLGGTNLIISPMILTGSNSFSVPLTIRIGSGKGVMTYTNSLTLSGNLNGPGSLNKQGGGTLYLSGANSFTGRTLVDNGTLALLGSSSLAASTNIALSGGTLGVTGRSDGLLTLVSGQTLSGNGTINGNVLAGAGSIVSPGTAIGTITLAGGSLTMAGTAFMQISKNSGLSDLINGAGTITYGGTLSLTNTGGTLVGGESFKLFDAVTYAGGFTNIVPATPGQYLAWDTTGLLTNGTLRVLYIPPPQFTSFAKIPGGFSLAFSGPSGSSYRVWATTNVTATPIISTWSVVASGSFNSGGTATFTDTSAPGYATRFYSLSVP
jgi:autotransporter-associated beta strand protein